MSCYNELNNLQLVSFPDHVGGLGTRLIQLFPFPFSLATLVNSQVVTIPAFHVTNDEGWGHKKLESCRRNKNLGLVLMQALAVILSFSL